MNTDYCAAEASHGDAVWVVGYVLLAFGSMLGTLLYIAWDERPRRRPVASPDPVDRAGVEHAAPSARTGVLPRPTYTSVGAGDSRASAPTGPTIRRESPPC